MNDNRFELLLFWPPLTHISLLLDSFCSLWCEFLFVYKLYGPLAFSIHFHSLNLKLLVKLILSRHAKKKEAKPPLRIIRIVTQSWGEFSTVGDENSVQKYRPKFSPDKNSCIDQSTFSMTSLMSHTVAQPTKCRFLPKKFNQLDMFVIQLAFTWSRVN